MNKHAKLFKQIPHGNFGASKLFFTKVHVPQTLDDIVLAYYHISTEMLDSIDYDRFIVRKNTPPFEPYDCHDPLTGIQIRIQEYKKQKLFNGIIKTYSNRSPSRDSGLVAKSKDGQDISSDIEDFKFFAEYYKGEHFRHDPFSNERIYRVGNHQLNHLYELLKILITKADFEYIQPGSIILAQEMANFMIKHDIIRNNQNTPYGIDYICQHKEFMFGELKHDTIKYQQIKENLKQRQK